MISDDFTIKDVAQRAKLSIATVSRILSGKKGHRPHTVDRVRKIAKRLEAESRAKEFGIPKCVGLLLFASPGFLNDCYNSPVISAIVESLTAENCTVQLIVLTEKNLAIPYIRSLVAQHAVKGLIVLEFAQLYALSRQLDALGLPIVKIGNLESPQTDERVVSADDYAAGRDAVNYLWSCGHRRFGIICMGLLDYGHRLRVRGMVDTVKALGGDPEQIWIREYYSYGATDSMAGAMAELHNRGDRERPSALVCTNSTLTRKLLAAMRRAGLEVPETISLLSFEEDHELEYAYPPITVMAQPTLAMGVSAAKQLTMLMNGHSVDQFPALPCSIIERQSVRRLSQGLSRR